MSEHRDAYHFLNDKTAFGEKLQNIHAVLKKRASFIERIALCLYDADSDLLKTYTSSSQDSSPLTNYEAKLANSESLKALTQLRQPRLANDMSIFNEGVNRHTQIIRDAGFQASYTFPLYAEGHFLGFLFFNSRQKNVFDELLLQELDVYGHLIAQLLYNEISKVLTLTATVKSAQQLTRQRDPETGAHLKRVRNYARLIARELADEFHLNDEYIEKLFLFSPLHDIGKLVIPDDVLLKPAQLTEEECQIMKTHAEKGKQIIDDLVANYGLDGVSNIDMLRNIAISHHESYDGTGYPRHLLADDIPIEARITSVADIFDALTSVRPYKKRWSNEDAFAELRRLSGHKLDSKCVDAFLKHPREILEIQKSFQDAPVEINQQ